MNKTIFHISIITLILNFGCKRDLKKSWEYDNQKTTELIIQILEDESNNYLSSSCITEKPRTIFYPMVMNFDKHVKKHLKIKDTIHYKKQKHFYKKFKITSKLVPNKNILTQKQFEEFEKKSKNKELRFWDWLDTYCNHGYCSISKPIFNKNYDLAYIQIGKVCGESCGAGEERIYTFVNGKWIKKENISSWIS